MFVAYCHKQEDQYVADECGVNVKTVARYRKLDNWEAQVQEVQVAIADMGDAAIAKRVIQVIGEVSAMRVDAYLCATRSKYKDAASAVRSYIELAKLELELRKPISQAAESLVNLARERFAQRRAGQGGQPAAPLDPEKQVEQAPSEASEPSNGVPHANETEGDDDANSLIDNGEGDAREGDDDGV